MTYNRLKWSVLIAAVCLIAFLALSYAAYRRLAQLVDYTRSVNQTNAFVLKLEEFISAHTDAETGVRGFLLTGDKSFLDPYEKAKKQVPVLLVKIPESFDTANAAVLQTFMTLKRLSREKFDSVLAPLAGKEWKIKQIDSARFQLDLLKEGKVKMDSIRRVAGVLKTSQESILNDQTKNQNKFSQLSPLYFLYDISIALMILLAAAAIIISQIIEMLAYQRELEQKILEINQNNEQLDQYSFTLTHHLQEPLRKIRLFASLFAYRNKTFLESNSEGLTLLEKIKDLASGVQTQLDHFLQFVKLNRRTDAALSEVNLNTIIQEIIAEKKEIIERTNAVVRADVMPVVAEANREQMKILFERVIDNALKFHAPGSAPVVKLTASKKLLKDTASDGKKTGDETAFHQLTVSDNGVGFDQNMADRIFNLFERLHAGEGFQGMGLGLTLAKRIVQLHRGFITVRSKVGEGTVFKIYLPA